MPDFGVASPALAPVTVVCGHYGVGKTNLALNLAVDAAGAGREVVLVDLDVVNPYFRSSDYRALLEGRGVRLVAPVFAGTTLDSPSVSGEIDTAIGWAQAAPAEGAPGRLLLIDAGGDDIGTTALGRYAGAIAEAPYAMLYVVNARRNLTQRPEEALGLLREIEAEAKLSASAVVNNSHLKQETDAAVIAAGLPFAREAARLAGLPLAFTTAPCGIAREEIERAGGLGEEDALYPVQIYVRTPWE